MPLFCEKEIVMRFKAGTYYVGDLCYVISDRWQEYITASNCCVVNDVVLDDGSEIWGHHTAFGDGCFSDDLGNEYYVDAGMIGVISIDDIDESPNFLKGGRVLTFPEDFEPSYLDGTFSIGRSTRGFVSISTGSDFDEDLDGEIADYREAM